MRLRWLSGWPLPAKSAQREFFARFISGSGNLEADIPPGQAGRLDTLRKHVQVRGRHSYRLHRRLGSGTFGQVWLAETVTVDPDAADVPPRAVAIKFFSPSFGGDSGDFIRRELAALLSMRADCIPRVYDWTVNERISFFVMDYYAHGTLSDVFEKPDCFDDESAWLLLVDLTRALKVAHRAGLLHLDIKPANIMRDGRGGYLLLDFGISQASQASGGPGQTIGAGSVGYQAPEQRRFQWDRLDTRTDLWALGATAWAARTGIDLRLHPSKVCSRPGPSGLSLPPLSKECFGCAPELDAIVMSLLQDDPARRPGGAAEVLERIKIATGITVEDGEEGVQPRPHTVEELATVVASLMDPLWSALCQRSDFARYFAKFHQGDYLCRQGDASHEAFVLLEGKVVTDRDGRVLGHDSREGTFVGELSTLTGTLRAASVRAETTVWVCAFNAAELERLLAAHPAIGIRLVKLMAERLIRTNRVIGAT